MTDCSWTPSRRRCVASDDLPTCRDHLAGIGGYSIILFASDGYDKFVADQLVEAFLDERTTMKWGGLIYNKQEWNSAGAWMPRVLTPEVRKAILAKRKARGDNNEVIDKVAFEHLTHIHIEWGAPNADTTSFGESLSARLKKVYDPGF